MLIKKAARAATAAKTTIKVSKPVDIFEVLRL